MADDVELGNPCKKARLDEDANDSVDADQAKLESSHYSSFTLGEVELNNQRNAVEGGHTDDEHPETSKSSAEPAADSDTDSSISALSNLSGLSGEESWKPTSGPMSWVYRQMSVGMNPREVLRQIIPHEALIPDLDDLTLWKLIINIMCEPPPRSKLGHINTMADVLQLMRTCHKIIVLTGAGVSVSCGIPDFRSRNGVYARLAVDYPDLPDPQAMFDIHYFRNDQRPFFKFAKEIFPGQFEPSKCHKFIRLIEDHGKLLRNYTQNIDTLEQVAGISRVIQCHGSFASATCMVCGHTCTADDIKDNIMEQVIPLCPKCPADTPQAVMKPDIVFFGESLPEEFHNQMAADKEECDLLIVIGSSLKVRPVALIPNSLPSNVPQILINKEPLRALNFDVELLGDCDTIVSELCRRLGDGWDSLSEDTEPLSEVTEDSLLTPPLTPSDTESKGSPSELSVSNEPKTETLQEARAESQVDNSRTSDSLSKGHEAEMELSTAADDSTVANRACVNKADVDTVSQESENKDTVMETALNSGVDTNSSEQRESTSGNMVDHTGENKTGGSKITSEKTTGAAEKIEGADSKSKNIVHDPEKTVTDTNESKAQSSESCKSEADNTVESEPNDQRAKKDGTAMCPTGVCYGDKDVCGCSADISELRKMWKPAIVRCCVSKRLGPNQYCFMPPSRYVFPEAEVYTVLEDTDSDSDSDADGLDNGMSDIENNTDLLNSSDEQFDKNNSCSEQDDAAIALKAESEDLQTNHIERDPMNLDGQNVNEANKYMWEKEDYDESDSGGFSSSSKENDNSNSGRGIEYPVVTTSSELSDSFIDNMDNFTKIDDEGKSLSDDIESREAAIRGFHIEFEGS